MSYEGREQHICANGHLFETSCSYQFDEGIVECHHCNAPSVWENSIDDTNGEAYGEIMHQEFDKLLIKAATYETCNLGHRHQVTEATYRIPSKNELKQSVYFQGKYQLIEEAYPWLDKA